MDGSEVWRDYVTPGVPSSGDHEPDKPDIRTWTADIEKHVLNRTVDVITGTYTVLNADKGKTLTLTNAWYTVTFGAAGGYDTTFAILLDNPSTTRAKRIDLDGVIHKLYPGQIGMVFKINGAWRLMKSRRWELPVATPTTIYVATTGSDTLNDGLDSGSPYLTLQAAFNEVIQNWDVPGNSDITMSVAAGTYTGGLHASAKPVGGEGGAQFTIQGAGATTIISPTGADAIGAFVDIALTIKAMKLQTTTSGHCINADLKSLVYIDDVRFGVCAGSHIRGTNNSVIQRITQCGLDGDFTTAHVQTSGGAMFDDTGGLTFTANIAGGVFAQANFNSSQTWNAAIALNGASATGTKKYQADWSATIFNNSGAVLPGADAGTTSLGGQYA